MGCFHLLAYFFICEVGTMVPRQGCCDEVIQCPVLAEHTAGLLDHLGPYKGLGSSLSTTLWAGGGDAGVTGGGHTSLTPRLLFPPSGQKPGRRSHLSLGWATSSWALAVSLVLSSWFTFWATSGASGYGKKNAPLPGFHVSV